MVAPCHHRVVARLEPGLTALAVGQRALDVPAVPGLLGQVREVGQDLVLHLAVLAERPPEQRGYALLVVPKPSTYKFVAQPCPSWVSCPLASLGVLASGPCADGASHSSRGR